MNSKFRVFMIRKNTYILVNCTNKETEISSFNMYNPSNKIKRIYKKVLMLLIKSSRVKFFYKNNIEIKINNKINNFIWDDSICYSIYTGTPGSTQKNTVQFMTIKGEVIGYCKIPIGKKSYSYIKNEYKVLKKLENVELKNTIVPKVIKEDIIGELYIQSSLSDLVDTENFLDEKIIKSIIEINMIDFKKYFLYETHLIKHFNEINHILRDVNEELANKIELFVNKNKKIVIDFGLTHMDFTPWNLKYFKNKLYVFDWEFSEQNLIGYDVFHYIFMVEVLVNKNTAEIIFKNIINNLFVENYFNYYQCDMNIKCLLALYFIEVIWQYYIQNDSDIKLAKKNIIIIRSVECLNYIFYNMEEYL